MVYLPMASWAIYSMYSQQPTTNSRHSRGGSFTYLGRLLPVAYHPSAKLLAGYVQQNQRIAILPPTTHHIGRLDLCYENRSVRDLVILEYCSK